MCFSKKLELRSGESAGIGHLSRTRHGRGSSLLDKRCALWPRWCAYSHSCAHTSHISAGRPPISASYGSSSARLPCLFHTRVLLAILPNTSAHCTAASPPLVSHRPCEGRERHDDTMRWGVGMPRVPCPPTTSVSVRRYNLPLTLRPPPLTHFAWCVTLSSRPLNAPLHLPAQPCDDATPFDSRPPHPRPRSLVGTRHCSALHLRIRIRSERGRGPDTVPCRAS